jgi:hypothetical protein
MVLADADTVREMPVRRGFAGALSVLRVPAWIVACYAVLATRADPDLWGHVRFGLDMLQSHHLPRVDPYSFTSDVAWTNHEWLAELIMGAAYSLMGAVGLFMIKAVLSIAISFGLASPLSRAPKPWRWPSGFLAVIGILPITLTLRPHLWTLLLLTLECRLLSGAPRRRYWLPLIFVVWANLHGGWIVGLGVLGLWSLIEMFEPARQRPSTWVMLGIPAACAIATLGNPYGWHLWEFLASTVGLSRPDISEWRPSWQSPLMLTLWIAGIVWVGMALRTAERRPAKVMAVLAMLAFASLRVNRIVPLFISAAVILLLPHISRLPAPTRHAWPENRALVDVAFTLIGVLILVLATPARCLRMYGSGLPDAYAANALAASNPTGRIVTWFSWGEYAIWHFGPALKVSMDGRRETVYSDAMLQWHKSITDGDPAALREFWKPPPEYVWLPLKSSDRVRAWLSSHGYRLDIETPLSFVGVRADLPKVIPAAAVASSGCFPGP